MAVSPLQGFGRNYWGGLWDILGGADGTGPLECSNVGFITPGYVIQTNYSFQKDNMVFLIFRLFMACMGVQLCGK